jgi:signal transduction histidine kinase
MRNWSLRFKLLFAFVVVTLTGILALIAAAELSAGWFYEAHISEMTQRYGSGAMDAMHSELYEGFSRSLAQSLLVGLTVGIPLAVLVGFWVARRVIEPVERVSRAARRIASGAYSERLPAGDLDEIGLLIEDFNRMAVALESVEARRIELIGTVAHELRTPLSGLQGYAEGLSDGLFDPGQAAQAIHREVSRLKRLVNDLSEVSKVESGVVALKLERFDLGLLLREVVERYEPMFLENGGVIQLTLSAQSLSVRADRDRVTQIVINLLSNAIKHAAGSPIEVRLGPDEFLNPKGVCLEVRDFGPGIPPEHVPHLFERFYRVDASRLSSTGGSGVGLTISNHLATAMGGRLEVTSELGKGSSFKLTLPAS